MDKESGDKDAGDEDGTESSSSAGSDISEDTKAELVMLIADRRAAKKRKLSLTSTDAVTASAAKVSVDTATRKARRNDASVAEGERKKSRVTLSRIISRIGTGTVAKKASLKISGVVQRYLPQLLSHKPAALPVANMYVCDTMAKIKGELDEAILTFDGQQELIDCTFTTFLVDLRSSGDAFRPVEAVIKSMASLSTSVTSKKTKTAINTACSGAQGFSPALLQQYWQQPQQQQGYHQQQLQLQHGGGQQTQQQWSDEFGMLCREPELLDGRTLQWACVKCGAGASYGARGHNAADCEASDAEIEAWVHHGQAAP